MKAVNEIDRKIQMNEIFLFCETTKSYGGNVFYLHLLIGLISYKK